MEYSSKGNIIVLNENSNSLNYINNINTNNLRNTSNINKNKSQKKNKDITFDVNNNKTETDDIDNLKTNIKTFKKNNNKSKSQLKSSLSLHNRAVNDYKINNPKSMFSQKNNIIISTDCNNTNNKSSSKYKTTKCLKTIDAESLAESINLKNLKLDKEQTLTRNLKLTIEKDNSNNNNSCNNNDNSNIDINNSFQSNDSNIINNNKNVKFLNNKSVQKDNKNCNKSKSYKTIKQVSKDIKEDDVLKDKLYKENIKQKLIEGAFDANKKEGVLISNKNIQMTLKTFNRNSIKYNYNNNKYNNINSYPISHRIVNNKVSYPLNYSTHNTQNKPKLSYTSVSTINKNSNNQLNYNYNYNTNNPVVSNTNLNNYFINYNTITTDVVNKLNNKENEYLVTDINNNVKLNNKPYDTRNSICSNNSKKIIPNSRLSNDSLKIIDKETIRQNINKYLEYTYNQNLNNYAKYVSCSSNINLNKSTNKNELSFFNIDLLNVNKEISENIYGKLYYSYTLFNNKFTNNTNNNKDYTVLRTTANNPKIVEILFNQFELSNKFKHVNIHQILGANITKLDNSSMCVNLLFDKYVIDLENYINKQIKNNSKFEEIELLKIIKSVSNVYKHLQSNNNGYHGAIFPGSIIFTNENKTKYNSHDNININYDTIKVLLPQITENTTNEYNKLFDFKFLKEIYKKNELYISPLLYKAYSNNIFSNINHSQSKSDVYSLGACILQASCLNTKSLHILRSKLGNEDIRKIIRKNIVTKYSNKFIELLSYMLTLDERKRYSWSLVFDNVSSILNSISSQEM